MHEPSLPMGEGRFETRLASSATASSVAHPIGRGSEIGACSASAIAANAVAALAGLDSDSMSQGSLEADLRVMKVHPGHTAVLASWPWHIPITLPPPHCKCMCCNIFAMLPFVPATGGLCKSTHPPLKHLP